jgi:hypothetical protein
MTESSWDNASHRLEEVLRDLPEIYESVHGGRLGNWYVVAEYEFDDHASLVRLHGGRSVKQTGWRSLGLLTYALEAERSDNFDYEDDGDDEAAHDGAHEAAHEGGHGHAH